MPMGEDRTFAQTVVKVIDEDNKISLLDSTMTISTGILTLSLFAGIISAIGVVGSIDVVPNSTAALVCASGLVVSSILVLLSCFSGIGYRRIPAYYVSGGFKTNGITIVKTTPEADQRAICAAVSTIEEELKRYINRKRELSEIASKCK